MNSYGWANAWRSLCWSRLKNSKNAYQLYINNLKPSTDGSNGTAQNLFDILNLSAGSGAFQIDANFGTPSAAVDMLVYSRPGYVELLPALPAAWAASGSVTGAGVRGGFTADISWKNGKATRLTLRSARRREHHRGGQWQVAHRQPAGRPVCHPHQPVTQMGSDQRCPRTTVAEFCEVWPPRRPASP